MGILSVKMSLESRPSSRQAQLNMGQTFPKVVSRALPRLRESSRISSFIQMPVLKMATFLLLVLGSQTKRSKKDQAAITSKPATLVATLFSVHPRSVKTRTSSCKNHKIIAVIKERITISKRLRRPHLNKIKTARKRQ